MRVFRFAANLLRIRRPEFLVAEVPIFLIPVFLSADHASFRRAPLVEGAIVFYLLFNFGDMINCLYDRDLDARYKPHLSRAVYELGVRFVGWQIAVSALLALLLSAHLAFRTGHVLLVPLVAVGLFLGAAYSATPLRWKSGGILQVIDLWLVIFVGPMLFAATLVHPFPPLPVVAFAAAYATVQMGVILVNTAEDFPEDVEAGLKTTITALGLWRGISLAVAMTWLGGIGVVAILGALFRKEGVDLSSGGAVPAAAFGCLLSGIAVTRVRSRMPRGDFDASLRDVRRGGRLVPFWLTFVAWASLLSAYVLYRHRP